MTLDINEKIKKLQDDEILFKDNSDKQHQLNANMIARFNNITTFINIDQTKLQAMVSAHPHIEQQLFQTQFYSSLQSQLQYLSDHIDDITTSIQLAKLGIISKHILNKSEVKTIRESLSKQLIIQNDDHVYELL